MHGYLLYSIGVEGLFLCPGIVYLKASTHDGTKSRLQCVHVKVTKSKRILNYVNVFFF